MVEFNNSVCNWQFRVLDGRIDRGGDLPFLQCFEETGEGEEGCIYNSITSPFLGDHIYPLQINVDVSASIQLLKKAKQYELIIYNLCTFCVDHE